MKLLFFINLVLFILLSFKGIDKQELEEVMKNINNHHASNNCFKVMVERSLYITDMDKPDDIGYIAMYKCNDERLIIEDLNVLYINTVMNISIYIDSLSKQIIIDHSHTDYFSMPLQNEMEQLISMVENFNIVKTSNGFEINIRLMDLDENSFMNIKTDKNYLLSEILLQYSIQDFMSTYGYLPENTVSDNIGLQTKYDYQNLERLPVLTTPFKEIMSGRYPVGFNVIDNRN